MAKRTRRDSVDASRIVEDDMMASASSNSDESTRPNKFASVEPEEGMAATTSMHCNLPPHRPMRFATYDDYENHYRQSHTNRCRECRKNFPSALFLEIHIAENHDPLAAARRDAGEKTYACFVEGCGKVCSVWQRRRSHLIDKHGFPKNYDFLVVNNGIDGRRSMLRPGIDAQGHRKSSRERTGSSATEAAVTAHSAKEDVSQTQVMNADAMEPSNGTAIVNVASLTDSLSALRMVPRSITFGQRKGKAGFARS